MIYRSLSCDDLVRACIDSDNAEAWQEFVCRFEPVIRGVIWRVTLSHGDRDHGLIEDLIQDTFFKFCDNERRVLRKFESRHEYAFFGMVKTVAWNVARDHYRKPRPPLIDGELSEVEPFLPDPETLNSDHFDRPVLCQDVDRILSAYASARDREIFWLYFGEIGFTAAEIAGIRRFDLDESGVESVIQRLKCLVRRKLAEREGNGPRGPDKAA
jgi:RNA polymerase sigma factor (sigma-70 family)